MKASELRIGNWITNTIDKEIFPCELGDLENLLNGWESYQPIPLTEEWLKRFGFEFIKCFVNNKEWKVTDYYKGTQKHGLKLSKGLNNPECFYFFQDNIGLKIKYVHQLQNLYFALTGQELNQNKEDE